jgi:formylglycine-generating enzyme required for sulfatase activity
VQWEARVINDSRALPGGSWHDNAEDCRAAFRGRTAQGNRDGNLGCRVCFCLD